MVESSKKVSVVVDEHYGARLSALVGTGAVWLIDTEENRMAATEYWQWPLLSTEVFS